MTNIKTISIEDLNITTSKLADGVVTRIKVADEAIGPDQVEPASLTGDLFVDGTIGTAKYADLSITGDKLAAESISGDKMAPASITGDKLADGSVGPEKFASGTFDSSVFEDGGINGEKLADGTVGTDQLASEAVTNAKIPANNIALNKLVNGTAGSILARDNTGVTVSIPAGSAGSVLTIVNGQPQFTSPMIPTGAIMDYWGQAAPSGWISCDGRTIGPLGSDATGLNAASAEALFKHIWNNFSNSIAPVTPTRGASADADWAAATKIIALPDLRGRVTICVDTEIDSVAPQTTITDAQYGGDVSTVGIFGGSSVHSLTVNEMPPHSHTLFTEATSVTDDQEPASGTSVGYEGIDGDVSTAYHLNFTESFVEPNVGKSGSAGGTAGEVIPHKNIQASVTVLKIIKI